MRARLFGLGLALALSVGLAGPARAASEAPHPPAQSWSWDGLFGTYDRASLQRGFHVYKEVCQACHSISLLAFRNLSQGAGGAPGLGFSEDEVKAIAAEYKVTDGPNDAGEMFERAARPSDRFPKPFPNEKAARASNNGAAPPDLSLIAKARANGPDYVFALLTGYSEPPRGMQMGEGMNYNKYFPGHQIAMAPPLNADAVTYADSTPASVDQMAKDVTAFLQWAAEPELEARKRMGIKVLLFLIVLAGMTYAVKRKVWADVH